ncbi:uncharacterized protein LOC142324990 [Lycorma delicatula]|uniref:uncharacterized protein LOC142324990 n=1 Tax=Lycorma delicatula TaxID=130591 RepID=UPI003F51148E
MKSSSETNLLIILFITLFLSVQGQWNFPEDTDTGNEEQQPNPQGQPVDDRYPPFGQRPGQIQPGFGQNPSGFPRPQQPNQEEFQPELQRPGGRPRPRPRPRPQSTTTSTTTQRTGSDESNTQSSTNGTQLTIPNEPSVINTVPCDCRFINNYNPVCGTNGKTYANRQVLDCHRQCGIDVVFKKLGTCGANRS